MEAACFAGRTGRRVAAPLPVAWLEGDVLAEYLKFLAEAPASASAPPTRVPVATLEGEVLAEFLRFLEEARDAAAAPAGVAGPKRNEEVAGGCGPSDRDGLVVHDDDDRESGARNRNRTSSSKPDAAAREAA